MSLANRFRMEADYNDYEAVVGASLQSVIIANPSVGRIKNEFNVKCYQNVIIAERLVQPIMTNQISPFGM